MSDSQSSYKQIIKATSLFGGVQVFNIIISIIRSKFIAVLLGPGGMGISGLLTTATSLISSITNFGISTSAVKDIAAANASGQSIRISIIIKVFRRIVWITGTLGLVVTLILSPWLSKYTFGNYSYTLAFVWISVTLLFNQFSAGQLVILQGMRKLQFLAKANIIGNILGLVFTIPLYYWFHINGIVPAIIITSIISMLVSWYFSKKIITVPVKISVARTIGEGKNMLLMGFMISLSSLITLGASYLIRIFISNKGGIEQVGLYNAGFAIIFGYVGLVFNAMSTDFYPRLSAVANSNNQCKEIINQQAEISVLILAPIIIIFLSFIHWIIILLYSLQFTAIKSMIYWAAIGMFFKAASWAIALILLAKGNSKIFFWNELLGNFYVLGLNILGYQYFGLEGLGITFLIGYLLYAIQVFIIGKLMYEFSFENKFIRIFLVQFSIAVICFLLIRYLTIPDYIYILPIFTSTLYSVIQLNKRIGFLKTIRSFKNKFN